MNFPIIITAFLAALTISAFAAPAKNVVIFLVDDLGCYGSDYYETPHIDQLAKEGLRFTDAYATCAVCTPTRASMLTGKYPARLLMTNWLPAGRWDATKNKLHEGRFLRALPLEEVTLKDLANGESKTYPRSEIKEISQAMSTMPPMIGILKKSEIRDLVAYLASLKAPK